MGAQLKHSTRLLTVPQLLTALQLSELLQVEIATIYVWTSKRLIPFRKVRGGLRFDYDEVMEWTKSHSL